MNTANIKSYAPKARRNFIQAVTEKAHLLGLSEDHIEPIEIKGDVAIIAGHPYPKRIGGLRKQLIDRINREGFEIVMRAMAYTWFNRFVAIRYMELHDYLDHGFRVLSNRSGSEIPEILEHATDVELHGLNKEEAVRLRLAGDKDNELYQLLVVAQCNALSQAMPFLFERIGGYAELLMPDNLLHSNSPVRNLVNDIPEEDWQQIEIIGWIYQFYISEKKNQVIGKVVKSEDIPAATQLFTPNWIVKYMVQNSLGAQWLATYPESKLKGQMEYYIEPAEQTDEVKAQLAAITPSTLNPEELTLIDPACGSGHILVEAYELFKAIYLERGYRQRDVVQLILEKNLFGLDIDRRAAQLTGFALMMKGRADDRRLFERGVKLNVMALVDSKGFDAEQLAKGVELSNYGLQSSDLTELKRLFEHATTFGSLIQVPKGLAVKLRALKQLNEATNQDLFVSDALKRLLGPLVQQAELLAAQYDAVVANPPYMGGKGMNALVKKFAKGHFPDAKSDLFSCFIKRGFTLAKDAGHNAMVTMQSWMFLSSYEKMRKRMLRERTIHTMAHLGARAFGSISGEVVSVSVFVCQNITIPEHQGAYFRLIIGNEEDKRCALKNQQQRHSIRQSEFHKLPGTTMAYWVGPATLKAFTNPRLDKSIGKAMTGMRTGDNERFLRYWYEVTYNNIGWQNSSSSLPLAKKWFPYNKGGDYRKWHGNNLIIVNWERDGKEIKDLCRKNYPSLGENLSWKITNENQYFQQGITWSGLSGMGTSFRYSEFNALFDSNMGAMLFPGTNITRIVTGMLNSKPCQHFLSIINPTLHVQNRDIDSLPFIGYQALDYFHNAPWDDLIDISSSDGASTELGPHFIANSLILQQQETIPSTWSAHKQACKEKITETKRLEKENNRLFIDAYDLADELTPDVPIEQITLTVNPAYRYGGKLTEEEQWTRFRQDTMAELVSYAIGCMMGRYSLGEPGLIYAHSGNEKFNEIYYNRKDAKDAKKKNRKKTLRPLRLCGENSSENQTSFPPDDDGIVPLTDTEWFDDDATHRLIEFISKAWDATHLEDNLTFLADNLSPKKNESSHDTIRRYLCYKFFKDHLKTYKKRPIYWLLSSGKQKAFQCLVYLHRYNESTLSRIRSAYVTPLFGKFNARLEYLENEREAATTASAKKKFQKGIDAIKKKLAELSTFDDELRHYADKRISLDLDDGVKVNYGKFGNLLAEKKAVTGKK